MLTDLIGFLPEISRILLVVSAGLAFLTILLSGRVLLLAEGSIVWKLFCVGFTLSMAVVVVFTWIVAQGFLHSAPVTIFYLVFVMTEITFLKLLNLVRTRIPHPLTRV